MIALLSANEGVCLSGRFAGWLMKRHADGQWVSVRKLETQQPQVSGVLAQLSVLAARHPAALAAAPEPPATRPEAEIRKEGIEMAADGWMPIETAPTDSHFIAAIKVRHTDGRSWWEQHIIWLDDEDGDVHPDCEQGWNISDYDAWRHLSPPPSATAIRALKEPGDEH